MSCSLNLRSTKLSRVIYPPEQSYSYTSAKLQSEFVGRL